jgi:thymidylate synthase (FAD)
MRKILYNRLADILLSKHQKELTEQGKSIKDAKKQAEKLAIEDARFVLPNSCETKMLVTMNARSLLNFFRLRCCNRAQWEIRAVAIDMLKLVKEAAPVLFKNAGPSCAFLCLFRGCNELRSGKKNEREYYKSL